MQYCKKKTNKLFFGKYVYKVAVNTPLAGYFRHNDLETVKTWLLEHHFQGKKRIKVQRVWAETWATENDFIFALELIEQLNLLTDHCLRIENKILGVYFNNEEYIDKIISIRGANLREVSKPEDEKIKEYLLSTPKVILRPGGYTHKYKVTVNQLEDRGVNFKAWASKIPKIKVSTKDFRWEGHFYVADEKTLDLCRIFLGDRIRKIEELVTVAEI